jgi:hypothetical protein
MQSIDFTDFANPSPRFWGTEKGAKFEEMIPGFARQVALKLRMLLVLSQISQHFF